MSENFEIVVEPEPEDFAVGVEETNRQIDERARDQAQADFLNFVVGEFSQRSELSSWPSRFRSAYEDEWSRLKAEREQRLASM